MVLWCVEDAEESLQIGLPCHALLPRVLRFIQCEWGEGSMRKWNKATFYIRIFHEWESKPRIPTKAG